MKIDWLKVAIAISILCLLSLTSYAQESGGNAFNQAWQKTHRSVVMVEPKDGKKAANSLGTGFLIHGNGYIVTAYHVVSDANQAKVTFFDGFTADSKAIITDKMSDLALIKVDSETVEDIEPLVWGDSEQIFMCQDCLAIGCPIGFQGTTTCGKISGLHTEIPSVLSHLKTGPYEDFLQADLSINSGNSGGPLLDCQGQVIGVVTKVITQGANSNMPLAVPSRMAKFVTDQLIRNFKVKRGYLGLKLRRPTAGERESADQCEEATGTVVEEVKSKDNPAGLAGVKKGDFITSYNDGGETSIVVLSHQHLTVLASTTLPGTEVTLNIVRDGKPEALKVTIGDVSEAVVEEAEEAKKDESSKD